MNLDSTDAFPDPLGLPLAGPLWMGRTHEAERSRRSCGIGPLVAACIGNGLEFYNVTIYAFVAVVLSRQFFAISNLKAAMLMTFGTFGVSYLVRPFGGLILGAYADRAGRRSAMLLTMILMFFGTSLIAFAPPYRAIGLAAPLLVLLGRLLQGFALGGELGSATAYLMEYAPKEKRALFVSLQFVSQNIGAVLAVFVGLILGRLRPTDMESWGWRVPFLAGLLIVPVGLYLARSIEDRPEALGGSSQRHPAGFLLRRYGWRIVIASLSVAILSANIYLRIFLPTFLSVQLHHPASNSYVLLLLAALTSSATILLTVRRVRTGNVVRWMTAVVAVTVVVLWPLLHMVDVYRSRMAVVIAYVTLAALSGLFTAAHGWFVSTLFPREVRAAGVGMSYNTGVMLFGGFAPALYTWLVSANGRLTDTMKYLVVAGVISIAAIWMSPRRHDEEDTVAVSFPVAEHE